MKLAKRGKAKSKDRQTIKQGGRQTSETDRRNEGVQSE